jgi:hypothetical protein
MHSPISARQIPRICSLREIPRNICGCRDFHLCSACTLACGMNPHCCDSIITIQRRRPRSLVRKNAEDFMSSPLRYIRLSLAQTLLTAVNTGAQPDRAAGIRTRVSRLGVAPLEPCVVHKAPLVDSDEKCIYGSRDSNPGLKLGKLKC